jgi:hypothetical protein|tara:strand:- start:277 stop:417 length:141 start_codon:yes stop_codon:yes gene_type:complete
MICSKCKKQFRKKMLDEADEALLRYNKKLKKIIRKVKNDTSKQTKR